MRTADQITSLVERASRDVAALWPLDEAVAANPLWGALADGFGVAAQRSADRKGVSPWPRDAHLAAAHGKTVRLGREATAAPRATLIARAGRDAARVRWIVGQALLIYTAQERRDSAALASALASVDVMRRERSWRDAAVSLVDGGLAGVVERIAWSDEDLVEEFARHFARLSGWSAWARWCDEWSRSEHPSRVSREELLTLSLAVDVAGVAEVGPDLAPMTPAVEVDAEGYARLLEIERLLDEDVVARLATAPTAGVTPRLQVLTCIDPRSEPLRRLLEEDPYVETFGVAGFFAVSARVHVAGAREPYDSLPALLAPTTEVVSTSTPTSSSRIGSATRDAFADLTHEPASMFALAEGAGWLSAPWMLAATWWPRLRSVSRPSLEEWECTGVGVDAAESLLRSIGLTGGFAPEVLLLGHGAASVANAHASTLECGACGAHSGLANAVAVAAALNDPAVRDALRERGIDVPSTTRFGAGEHVTTTQEVRLGDVGPYAHAVVARLGERVRSGSRDRRRRSKDWAEVRPEWGLAGHHAFLIAPRRSTRGCDLGTKVFLHSYDASRDLDGEVLSQILAAPVVVAHWINAAYYFSAVAPSVWGAGDKTRHNPVGDFAVVAGDDVDPLLGLARQSLVEGERPYHLPSRLLVAVEAPLERVATAIAAVPVVSTLVQGEWVRVIARAESSEPWSTWAPGEGWR